MNIAKNLEISAFHFPDNLALMDEKASLSYRQVDIESNKIAAAIQKTGIAPGDPVALCAPNSNEWLCFYFGILKAGAVAVTLPYAMTRSELIPVLDDCKPVMMFTDDKKFSDFEAIACIKTIISGTSKPGTRHTTYDALILNETGSFQTIEREPGDTAAILYTGGTTGVSKGVELTHRNIMTSALNVARCERSDENDRALCFLPLNHVFAQMHIMNSTIFSAGGLVIQSSFNMELLLKAVKEFQVTKFFSVPTVYIRLLSLPDLKEKLGSIRYCFSAAASMAREVVKEWKTLTGLDIFEAYGMTESASMVTFNHYYRHVAGSVGTAVPQVEIRICDDEGHVLGKNEPGEICISGPNIMKGYLNRKKDTEAAFRGRWFRSGDVGYLDDDSYLYIVDRIKELIITGGENVSPREVEEILYTRHEIEECAVIGLPDKEYGEKIVAYMIPRPGQQIDPVSLKAYLKTRLSPFKVPKEFISVSSLPKSSTGKLLKRELKTRAMEKSDKA
ncbi:MAG: AMP-binding protein [Desulfobacterales bacterium RIFOXYA12_FULL_46_15]|nr:MAG: AMP-binding protein [Desulfobacterales bacterium RIFOXYA12_FULL_46_15]